MTQAKNNHNGKRSFFHHELFMRYEPVFYFLMIFLAVLVLWIGAKFFNEIKILSRPDINAPTISVSGEGKIFARPDIGFLSFAAEAESLDAAQAQRASAEIVNNVVKFLKNSGLEEKDLKTTNYSVSPVYDFPKGRREFRGYKVSQNMEIKIRDLSKTGAVLSGLAVFGVTDIGSLDFKIDQIDELKNQARKKAIEDAGQKAQRLASSLGVKLGKIVSFYESGQVPPIFAAKTFAEVGGSAPVIPEVPSGENEITSFVTVVFELK